MPIGPWPEKIVRFNLGVVRFIDYILLILR